MKRITKLAGATLVAAGILMITPRVDAATSYVQPATTAVFDAKLHTVSAQYVQASARVRAAEVQQGRLQKDFAAQSKRYLQLQAHARSAVHPQPESTMVSLKLNGLWIQKAAVLARAAQSVNAMFSRSVTRTSQLLDRDLGLLHASVREHALAQMSADQGQTLLEEHARLAMEQEWGLELQQMNVQLQNLMKLQPSATVVHVG